MSNVQNHCHPHGTLPYQPYAEQTYKPAPVRTPHKCPVCIGRGFVDAGFYTATGQTWGGPGTNPDTCRTCEGTGIVWDEQPASPLAGLPQYSSFSVSIKSDPDTYQTYQSMDGPGTFLGQNGIRFTFDNASAALVSTGE